MNRRERLRRCFFHEELDRPEVYCRAGFPNDDSTYDELKAYFLEHTAIKVPWSYGGLETVYATNDTTEPHSDDFDRLVRVLPTPKGDLTCAHFVSTHGEPGLTAEHYLKSREDAEKYLSLPLPTIEGDASSFFETDAEIGDKGIVDVGVGTNPAGRVADLFGSQTFAVMSVTDRDIIHALCERFQTILMNRAKFFIENKVGPFFSILGQEYVVPPMHGPEDFHEFNVRYDKPVLDLIHNAGGRVHIHCHGSVKKVFQQFIDMGTDVLHPIEPPPMGDITAAEAKKLAGDRLCLEGNIQIDRMYEATPEEMRAETETLIHDAFSDHKGLIVCPSASPFIRGAGADCFPQFKAMIDTVLDWRE